MFEPEKFVVLSYFTDFFATGSLFYPVAEYFAGKSPRKMVSIMDSDAGLRGLPRVAAGDAGGWEGGRGLARRLCASM